MKNNLVLKGTNEKDEKVFILLDLMADENKVMVYTIPEKDVTDELETRLMNEWRAGSTVEMPESTTKIERELTVTDSILPEGLKTDRTDLINRAQTQWHFVVLSGKLNSMYQSELVDIKEKVQQLEQFSQDSWDDLKGFWQKVQEQVRDKNLFAEHANVLRENTNVLFDRLKDLKTTLEEEVQRSSKNILQEFHTAVGAIEDKINEGGRLQNLFDDLKDLQSSFKDLRFTRDDRAEAWDKLDNAFKKLKEKKFGGSAVDGGEASPLARTQRRYDGLMEAIGKMEQSISRDKSDLDFHSRKANSTDRQLEALVAQAKLAMINERINSKQEKLNEMLKTKTELEARLEDFKNKELVQLEHDKFGEARKVAEEKIAQEIRSVAEQRTVDASKLEKVSAEINQAKSKPKVNGEESKVKAEETNAIQNAIETSKAIASIDTPEK